VIVLAEKKEHKHLKDDSSVTKKIATVILFACITILVIVGAIKVVQMVNDKNFDSLNDKSAFIKTFKVKENAQICTENGKPIIRLFSTTWCPHCKWVKADFDSIAKEYVANGSIVAYHWEIDQSDNTLTDAVEGSIPDSEMAIFNEFNPDGTIPTFVIGCKYYRVGNGYETANDMASERQELKAVIEQVVKEAK
jgi:thiol-disulfide isomerase/thioredoxin